MASASPNRRGPRAASVGLEIIRWQDRIIERLDGERFPMLRYQSDPVAFVRDQIGEEPMAHQAEIMLAVAAGDSGKVAVRSGQKTGKTKLVVWLALWYFASFPQGRVFMTASTAPQVKRVLWAEMRRTMLTAKGARGTDFGVLPQNPETGLIADDGREILGFTTRTIESMAGLSGANMLFIGDEASSFESDMAQAIEGNTAGAARIIWISNPTRAEGPFYDCFFSKKRFWSTFHLSSEDLARKHDKAGLKVPGVATLRTIERWAEEYGVDSPFYLVRARGEFVLDEQAKIVSLHNIMTAQQRWAGAVEEGPLSIGCDPAGDRGEGDEFLFAVVRGAKLLALYPFRGISEESAVANALGILKDHRRDGDSPAIVVDAEGPIGSSFYGRMRALGLHREIHLPGFSYACYGIKSSMPARRAPQLYERVRDELWAGLADWMRSGAIPSDRKLEEELYAPGFLVSVRGQRRATHKDILREKLGRSPDRADALALAVWSPSPWVKDEFAGLPNEEVNVGPGVSDDDDDGGLNPHGNRGGGFSPWG